ncbi:phage baseplate assembly protein V [Microvirga solisilvae]|uniref:phage baseplate assembly protein V n=1 Tax=Microvirga solisilvae TaxID=2919498 RepID=UPI001FAF90F0|nr:phage baseplate assembly protein V [Microvirga solisilvae]
MTQDEMDAAIRTMIRRATLVSTDDGGSQQKMKLKGLSGEEMEDVVRIQHFGESSVPLPGSEAIMLSLGGRTDRAVVIGFEHKDHRPTGYAPGDKVIYDGHGNIISLVQAQMRIVHASRIEMKVGGVSMTMTADGIAFTGGEVTHDGKHIDASHIHGGVVPGGGTSSVPAN